MKHNNNLLKTNKYGSRWDIQKLTLEKEYAFVGVIVTLVACVLDFANVFTRYDNITKPTSVLMLIAMTTATVIVLDVPMYIAGSVLKSYMQKLKPKSETIIIISGSVAAFLTLAILNLLLSLECGRFLLEDPAVKEAGMFAEVESTNSVMIGAWILGLLPILTSIASFVVGLYCSNPRLHNVNQLKKALNQIYTFISQAKRAQAEAFFYDPKLASFSAAIYTLINDMRNVDPNNHESQLNVIKRFEEFADKVDDTYINSELLKHVISKHRAAVEEVYAQELVREQATYTALQRKLNTPDDISIVSEEAIKVSDNYQPSYAPADIID